MKKICILLLIVILLLSAGCSNSKVDDCTSSNSTDVPLENEVSNNDSIIQSMSQEVYNGFVIKKLTTHNPKEYLMGNINCRFSN